MSTLTLTVPQAVKTFAKQRAEQAGFEGTSAYVESLIRRDRAQAARGKLVQEIRKGLDGPWVKEEDFRAGVRARFDAHVKQMKAGKK